MKTENGSLLRTEMKHTLFSSLLTYVKGEARAEVIGMRVGAVFEAYCQLYKKGVKANEVNILRKRVSAMAPQKATKISEVKEKVRAWKSDLTYLKEMDGQYQMQEADKAAILFSILPPDLMRDLVKKVPDRRKFHEVEKELESVLQALEELDPRQSKSIGKLQLVVTEGEKEEESQEKPGACHHEHAGDDGAFYDEWYGQYIAFVKRSAEDNDEENPAKRQKGKGHEVGKGKGKSKGAEDRKCYNCGEPGHLARNCPRQYVPPKTVWGSWWPGKGYGKGGKGGNGGKGGKGGKGSKGATGGKGPANHIADEGWYWSQPPILAQVYPDPYSWGQGSDLAFVGKGLEVVKGGEVDGDDSEAAAKDDIPIDSKSGSAGQLKQRGKPSKSRTMTMMKSLPRRKTYEHPNQFATLEEDD